MWVEGVEHTGRVFAFGCNSRPPFFVVSVFARPQVPQLPCRKSGRSSRGVRIWHRFGSVISRGSCEQRAGLLVEMLSAFAGVPAVACRGSAQILHASRVASLPRRIKYGKRPTCAVTECMDESYGRRSQVLLHLKLRRSSTAHIRARGGISKAMRRQ